ncbi:GNAT family protein [Psychrobacillus sp. FSL K6-2684]|uniref:GNAT family N-acetyltransferase n=1 Tax=unclassified Psychrobacillus TaxID=2636677 RepID=UPI0012483B92|nr:GNAT family protein [Psychrobacillus sp. AK 1817]QEY19695.1 N-acetyltransferase [Psychrobacillus sp. AK 1817]
MNVEKIYGDLPILETERLILRKVTLEDIQDMYLYGSDEEVSKYVTWNTHETISDTKGFVEFVLNKYENKQVSPWGIECKENGKFIGTIDFVWWQPNNKTAEIGYVISKDYWRKGLTSEVAKEIIKFGFEKMDLVRIQARCDVENIGSARVMEKAGMSFEGIIRKGIFVKGMHRDLKMYSILKEEFNYSNETRT